MWWVLGPGLGQGFFSWWAGFVAGLQVGRALGCYGCLGLGSADPAAPAPPPPPMFLGTQLPYATKVLIYISTLYFHSWNKISAKLFHTNQQDHSTKRAAMWQATIYSIPLILAYQIWQQPHHHLWCYTWHSYPLQQSKEQNKKLVSKVDYISHKWMKY